ncbi:MAG: hypothetical protein IJS60_08685 [Abditibacteriota bacterium]|nr:hypothetical protein [Abditibacteriota bacterium]
MRILFLVNHYNTLRVFRKELLIKLNKEGHKVFISLPADKEVYMNELKSFGCEIFLLR